jgi:hypothetical protein
MKRAMLVALAAMLMIPAAGTLQAQGKGQAKRQESGQVKRQGDDQARRDEPRLRRQEKPGRRVGPSPYGPGRRVGPNGAKHDGRGGWSDYAIGRRSDLGLSDRQVSEIAVIRKRYDRDDARYARSSGGTKQPAERSGTVGGERKSTTADRDEYRKAAEVRAKERREIDAVLTPAQRAKLKQRATDEKAGGDR